MGGFCTSNGDSKPQTGTVSWTVNKDETIRFDLSEVSLHSALVYIWLETMYNFVISIEYKDLLIIMEYSSLLISSSGCLGYKWLNAGFACRGWIKLLSRSWQFSSEI